MQDKEIKEAVKGRYAEIAKDEQRCGCGCCGPNSLEQAETIGYLRADLEGIPDEAILGLGCGNPAGMASLKHGEVVLDLGSGAGIDVFLAANKVGRDGKAIGVDMTEEMVLKAQAIAQQQGYENIEFRLGEIEALPIEDNSVDVIISNCVINLAPDKSKVFREAHRVLKPGGRVVVSDIVTDGTLPEETKCDLNAWAGCIAGALEQQEYLEKIRNAGFDKVRVTSERGFNLKDNNDRTLGRLVSIAVEAYKPGGRN